MLSLKEANKTNHSFQEKQILSLREIENWYLSGVKNSLNIGLEYERLSLDKTTFKNAQYDKRRYYRAVCFSLHRSNKKDVRYHCLA